MTWTTTELLASLRRRGRLPDGDPSDADLLLDADHALRTTCMTLLRTLREGYSLVRSTTAIVANQNYYQIPRRALGATVDDLLFVDDNGKERSMPMVDYSDLHRYADRASRDWRAPYAFAIRGTDVVIAPTPTTATGSLRFVYMERPGKLVAASRGAQVVSAIGDTFLLDGAGALGASTTIRVDIRGANPPHTLFADNHQSSWFVGSFSLETAGVTDPPDRYTEIQTGDWVTLPFETVVVPVPEVMQSLLVHATLALTYQALGHREEMAMAERAVAVETEACRQQLEPRVTEESRPVLNPHSPLRGRRFPGGAW